MTTGNSKYATWQLSLGHSTPHNQLAANRSAAHIQRKGRPLTTTHARGRNPLYNVYQNHPIEEKNVSHHTETQRQPITRSVTPSEGCELY